MTITINRVDTRLALASLEVAKSVAVVILAHDEAGVIESTVRSVCRVLDPQDAVYVIADNCGDATADRAAGAGAYVRERLSGGPDGKGAALKWFVDQAGDLLERYDLAVILDADNQVPAGFMQDVKKSYIGEGILQCFVQPVGYQGSPLGTLIALSEIHEQKTIDGMRARLGWPVRLRGTGMVMSPGMLKIVANMLDTEVEDIALSLLYSARGIHVQKNMQVCVYDPKPRESILASRQRARWFRGQWVAFWHYRRDVLALIRQGLPGWSLLSSLFLKPRWLLDLIMLGLAFACAWFSWLLAALFLSRVLFDLVCLGWTIFSSEDRKDYLIAILHVPAFIFMWIRSFLLAFQKSPWQRARQ
ncbi:MAG: glycosyltransferase [Anaerolineales bacterium]|jgi:cellulose synthase/poly-beta-1,6-N-acetylglucosamine synthase-like glycosyltransferase